MSELSEAELDSLCICGYGVVCQECLLVYRRERDALRAQVARVEALHTPDLPKYPKWCVACGQELPCDTLLALAPAVTP